MPSISNINIISTTTYNGRYAYFLGGLYGYVYWNSTLSQWENASGLGTGTVYNYLPSTALQPITSPTAQWVNVVPGFEIFACIIGDCEDRICFYGVFTEGNCTPEANPIVHCNRFIYGYPAGTTSNGYLYYIIEVPGSTTYYVWYYSTNSEWVMTSVLEDYSTVVGALTSTDPDRPIGNWYGFEAVPQVAQTSYFECTSTLCLRIAYEAAGILEPTSGMLHPSVVHNGKISYEDIYFGLFTIYWNNTLNRWELSENGYDDPNPIAYLEYQGDFPLTGILPDNYQWIVNTLDYGATVYYTSIGELDGNEAGIHGPCYLPVCFNYADETYGGQSCLTYPEGIYNEKPYFILKAPVDCTLNMDYDGSDGYVWWDETNSRWVLSFGLGDLTPIINDNILTTSSDDLYPSGTWTNGLNVGGAIIGVSTIGECVTENCYTITSTTTNIITTGDLEDYLGVPNLTYIQTYPPFSTNGALLAGQSTTVLLTPTEAVNLDGSAEWIITGPIECPPFT